MARKRRSSYSSASTSATSDEETVAGKPPPKKKAVLSSAHSPPITVIKGDSTASTSAVNSTPGLPCLSPAEIQQRLTAAQLELSAMPELGDIRPFASNKPIAHHYALQKRVAPSIHPLDSSLPRNTDFPPLDSLNYPAKGKGKARVAFWNINAILDSGRHFTSDYKKSIDAKYGETKVKSVKTATALEAYLRAEDPDMVILAETKLPQGMSLEDVEEELPFVVTRYPYRTWARASKSSYAGVAILSRFKPLSTSTGLPEAPSATHPEGRLACLEFEQLFVVGAYVPHCGMPVSGEKMQNRAAWDEAFRSYVHKLMDRKLVLVAADFNVTPTDNDLRRPEYHRNRTGGVTKPERENWLKLCYPSGKHDDALVDSWREQHPQAKGQYTYTGYSKNHREHGEGLRIDTFLVSNTLYNCVDACEIRHDAFGPSDHLPIALDISADLF